MVAISGGGSENEDVKMMKSQNLRKKFLTETEMGDEKTEERDRISFKMT